MYDKYTATAAGGDCWMISSSLRGYVRTMRGQFDAEAFCVLMNAGVHQITVDRLLATPVPVEPGSDSYDWPFMKDRRAK
jgi:hypothetical protein